MTGPIRVLHIIHRMDRGGIETWLMNVLRNIDRDRFRFDFMVYTTDHCAYDDEIRALGVVLFNWLISALTLTRITDCSNGFRAIRADALAQLELEQTQYHATEQLIEALKKGLRVVEVPVTIRRRSSGESKKGPTVRYAFGFTRAIIGTWLR